MNNVAEGFDRNNKKELRHFLQIAKGSSGEVGSMLELAVELRHIGQDTYLSLSDILGHVRRLLVSFIRSVRLKIK